MYSGKYYQGRFKPKCPEKYAGDPTNIIYRSSWELRVMRYLDSNPSIVEWSSEETVIPYKSPIDNKVHRYFPDFRVKALTKNGTFKEMIWEVKPSKQIVAPQRTGTTLTKRYINEVATYGVNQAKWKAAEQYCIQRGWTFAVISEEDLFQKKA